MNKTDKKAVRAIFLKGIDQIIMPVLNKILDELKSTKDELKTKPSRKEMNQRFDELSANDDRIERKLDSTVVRVDKHELLMKK